MAPSTSTGWSEYFWNAWNDAIMSRITIGALHGWAMHNGLFRDLIDALPETDWHGIDLPGHGRNRDTPWPEDADSLVEGLVRDLAEGSWLMGWSLGGLLAMQAALKYPTRFAGLVLVSATPCFIAREHWPDGVEAGLLKAMALELAADPEVVVNRFLALEIHGSAHQRDELKRLKSLATAHGLPNKAALLAGLKHLAETDLSGRLGEIECPVLLLGGRRDKLVPWASLEHTHRLLPNSRLVRVPGAAHAPFLTDAAAVADAIRGFLNEADESN
ncbi:MAG: pimeloyl-[acyl-carrier protein] methyl ester esterase [Xanthomonadales bacterium]|nr:pimeloyl-[acyl-carrier protein] methyl ester esterase [Xanthomonadales bacterium]